jgi:hypothetical protein
MKNVIEMYYSTTNQQDVAEPDAMVSGTAGTGQEHKGGIAAPAASSPGYRRNGISVQSRRMQRSTARLVKKIGRLVNRVEQRERHRQRGRYLSPASRNACCRELIAGWLDGMIARMGERLETIEERGRS